MEKLIKVFIQNNQYHNYKYVVAYIVEIRFVFNWIKYLVRVYEIYNCLYIINMFSKLMSYNYETNDTK